MRRRGREGEKEGGREGDDKLVFYRTYPAEEEEAAEGDLSTSEKDTLVRHIIIIITHSLLLLSPSALSLLYSKRYRYRACCTDGGFMA